MLHFPQAGLRIAKGWHSVFGGNTGPGEHRYPFRSFEFW
jgi:hypothetical protein